MNTKIYENCEKFETNIFELTRKWNWAVAKGESHKGANRKSERKIIKYLVFVFFSQISVGLKNVGRVRRGEIYNPNKSLKVKKFRVVFQILLSLLLVLLSIDLESGLNKALTR